MANSAVFRLRADSKARMAMKTLEFVDKELDLVRLIRRLRMLILTSLGALTMDQRVVTKRMTDMVINDYTSVSEYVSSDNQVEMEKKVRRATMRLETSKNRTDKRFLALYRF